MIAILTLILGLLLGLYVSHHCLVVPLWDTESGLRKELKGLRTKLYITKYDHPIFRPIHPVKILHHAHSKVRFISHPGDLLK